MVRARRRWLMFALAVATLLIIGVMIFRLVSVCCALPDTIAPGAGEFMFMSNRDGDWDIYLMTLPDRTVQNLTNNDVDDGFGAFSVGGEAITFLSNRLPEEGLTAYMMNADGTNVNRMQNDLPTILNVLATGRMNWDLSFEPSNAAAFVSLRDLNLEIYVQTHDADGQASEHNLSQNGAIDWYPSLSFDGRRIAFSSDRDGNQEIYVMNVDGTDVRRLTDQPGDDLFPTWAGDSRQIIFYSERETTLAGGALALYVMDADAENPTPVRLDGTAQSLETGDPIPVDINFNSDGSGRLYMHYDGHDWDIFYADLVGRHEINLTDDDSQDLCPEWR
jgi:TolB protein